MLGTRPPAFGKILRLAERTPDVHNSETNLLSHDGPFPRRNVGKTNLALGRKPATGRRINRTSRDA